MKAKLYMYSNGQGKFWFNDNIVLDEGGRGCWEIEIDIPEYLNPYISAMDKIIIEPENAPKYELTEAAHEDGNHILIKYLDWNRKEHFIKLKKLSERQKSTAMYL